MGRLVIGNQLTEETADGDGALPSEYRHFLSVLSHRMLWLAQDGDVVVLPSRPAPEFEDYVSRRLGRSGPGPVVVVPPDGRQGGDLLFDDRLADASFLEQIRKLIDAEGIDRVLPYYLDDAVLRLARSLGLDSAHSSLDFAAQRGGEIVNSKAVFRAVAAGNGVPTPDGVVAADAAEAEDYAWRLLAEGQSVILKQDLHGGTYGNELLTPAAGIEGVGANATTVVPDRATLSRHLAANWDRYTYHGARRLVVEHFVHDCGQLYIEFLITDAGATVAEYGEIRMKPVLNGLVIPPQSVGKETLAQFVAGATRMAEAVRAIGYRGYAGLDAIVTPAGQVLFNEVNGRIAGSTHLDVLARAAVGPDYLDQRVLISRNRCAWPSLAAALARFEERGLAFDDEDRTGVLIATDDDTRLADPTGQVLMVGRDFDHAQQLEDAVLTVLGRDD